MEHLVEIGRLLKKIRSSKELTLKQVSNESGIDVASLSQLENGKKNLNPTRLRNLCAYYNLPYEVVAFRSLKLEHIKEERREAFGEIQKHINDIIDEIFEIRVLYDK